MADAPSLVPSEREQAIPSYAQLPLKPSEYGRQMYEAGRRLVLQSGVRMSEIIWDADEILWDWLVDLREVVRASGRMVLRQDLGHREYFRIKPGIFELVWGMHHGSIESGEDPYMRIWTNGYAWRVWRIARQVPGWDELLGAPADSSRQTHESYAWHPRIFCRADFARATRRLLRPHSREAALLRMDPAVRAVFRRQLATTPLDSTFKIPELGAMAGKNGFEQAAILIDDQERNIRRFVATGRRAVHARSAVSRWSGRMPNTTWSSPSRVLSARSTRIAESIAHALGRLAGAPAGFVERAESSTPVTSYDFIEFAIEVPDAMVRSEWIEPVRSLRRVMNVWGRT